MRTTTLGISGLDGLGGPLSFWASCYLLIGRHSLTKVGCLPFLSWNVVEILAISLAADSKTLSIKKKKRINSFDFFLWSLEQDTPPVIFHGSVGWPCVVEALSPTPSFSGTYPMLDSKIQVAIAKYYRLGSLNNRNKRATYKNQMHFY